MEKQELEKQIKIRIERIKKEIDVLRDLTRPVAPDSAIGRVSRMDAINNKSVNEAALRVKEMKLNALISTINRINDPGFGICTNCGQAIPTGRIMLMPESKKCVACAVK